MKIRSRRTKASLPEDKMEQTQTDSTNTPTDMLFSLPSELLLLIFTFIGFLNFRQDVSRLHVSKNWYPYAKAVLLGNLHLDSDDLEPILVAMRKAVKLAAAQQLTKHIELTLQTSPRPRTLENIEKLMSNLMRFTELRTLIIRCRPGWIRIPCHIIETFVSLYQLTSLEIDLIDTIYVPCTTHHHLCKSINQLLPNLKSLRCRLPWICDEMLESPPGVLKELIISITCSEPGIGSMCCSEDFCSDYELRRSLETRLLQFVASMRDPKIVRLIYSVWCGERTYAFDAMKNRRLLLTKTPDWDEDGVLLPEDWEEDSDVDDEQSINDDASDDEEMGPGDYGQAIFEGEGGDDE